MTEEQRPKILPVVIGIALTGILLACLAYAARLRNAAEATMAPELTIVAPAESAVVDSPLVIRFRSAHPLDLMDTGWGHDSFHLHASLNGVEYMPAASDIVLTGEQYSWTIHAPRGPVRFYLGWADHMHRALQKGMTDTVSASIR